MCRMFMLNGDFSENFHEIFKVSKSISCSDPLHITSDSLPKDHKDGWGFVNLTSDHIAHFRTSDPLCDSSEPQVNNGHLIFHMRNAAPNEPMGIHNSHPFHISTEEGDFYLAHNGWFDKEKIANFIGLKGYASENDSLIFLRFLASRHGDLQHKIRESIDISLKMGFIKSTANLMILFVDKKGKPSMFSITEASPTSNYGKYQELYRLENEKWTGIFSSSFMEFSEIKKLGKISKLERGLIYEI